jgi:hypothetical protein
VALTNGVIERMKAATHTLVTMEIERAPEPIRDQESYRRKRLPEIFADHQDEWREAYMANPKITVNEFVTMVTGQRVDANRAARTVMERNMDRVRALAKVEADRDRNLAGIDQARRALRGK